MIVSVHNTQCDMYTTVQYSTVQVTSPPGTVQWERRDGLRKESRHYDPGAGMGMVNNAVLMLQISILGLEEWRC